MNNIKIHDVLDPLTFVWGMPFLLEQKTRHLFAENLFKLREHLHIFRLATGIERHLNSNGIFFLRYIKFCLAFCVQLEDAVKIFELVI